MFNKFKSWLRKKIAFYKLNKSIKKMLRFPRAIKKATKEIYELQRSIQRKI